MKLASKAAALFQPIAEQHMLRNIKPYAKLLGNLDLTQATVIEFGAGDGALTQEILKQTPKKLIAYEIDSTLVAKLKKLTSSALDVKITDFTKEDFSYLKQEGRYVIISNPPYSAIPFLQENVIKKYGIHDVIMMTSQKKKQEHFDGYELAFTHKGDDFSPPASGEHFVMKKGFKDLTKSFVAAPSDTKEERACFKKS